MSDDKKAKRVLVSFVLLVCIWLVYWMVTDNYKYNNPEEIWESTAKERIEELIEEKPVFEYEINGIVYYDFINRLNESVVIKRDGDSAITFVKPTSGDIYRISEENVITKDNDGSVATLCKILSSNLDDCSRYKGLKGELLVFKVSDNDTKEVTTYNIVISKKDTKIRYNTITESGYSLGIVEETLIGYSNDWELGNYWYGDIQDGESSEGTLPVIKPE